jgi:hypothetical protein
MKIKGVNGKIITVSQVGILVTPVLSYLEMELDDLRDVVSQLLPCDWDPSFLVVQGQDLMWCLAH